MNKIMDKQNMGWGIFLISAGLAAMVDQYTGLAEWIKYSIFFLGGLSALLIYLTDRSDWGILIPSYTMLSISVVGWLLIFDIINEDLIGSVVLAIIAIPFLLVYIKDKGNWWALIPAYSLFSIALIIMLSNLNVVGDEFIGPFILFSIAIPFIYVYFQNKENWWALIPAYTMIIVGSMVGMIELNILRELLIPAFILLAIAFPFFIVYFLNKENWWALIPGGILGVIGLGFLISTSIGNIIIPAALIISGAYLMMRKRN